MNGYVTIIQMGDTFVAFGLGDDNRLFIVGGERPFPDFTLEKGDKK